MELTNEFYVALLSNASLNIHGSNTLSSFTNQLSKACRLDQNWVVGLVEIGINNYKKSANFELPKREIYSQLETFNEEGDTQTQHESSDEDYEIISQIKRMKRSSDILEINYGSDIDIKKVVLYKNDLRHIAYNSNTINFGALLELLEKNINRNKTKRVFKEKMLKFLSTIDSIGEIKQIPREKYDFVLRIYQGKNEPDIVTLKLDSYNGVSAFLKHIISQIPKKKRKKGSLIYTVNHGFYPSYKINDESNVDIKPKLEIPLNKNKAKIVPNLDKLKPLSDGSVNLEDIITNIDDFIKCDESEQKKIKNELTESIDNFFKKFNNNNPQILVPANDNTFQLNVPTDDYTTHTVNVENKDYGNVENFLNQIFLQVPVEKRSKEALEDALEKLHGLQKQVDILNQANLKNKSESLTVDSTLDLLYVYTDIIKPRLIGHISSRYLKVIPVIPGDMKFRYTHIEYCPIQPSYIESISILITDGNGKNINFDKTSTPTYALLHFKKI